MRVSVGAGVKSTRSETLDLESPAELQAVLEGRPDEVEAWVSPFAWRDDDRSNNMTACHGVAVDIDYEGHEAPPAEAREAFAGAMEDPPTGATLWHHTPGGARVWYGFARPVTDPGEAHAAVRGVYRVVRAWLGDHGLAGYQTDAGARDLKRISFAAHCRAKGRRRADPVHVVGGWIVAAPFVDVGQVEDPAESRASIASGLAKRPATAEGDGSLDLIRTCAAAVGAGIRDEGALLEVIGPWRAKSDKARAKAGLGEWTDDEVLARYHAALDRAEEEGLVPIPIGPDGKPKVSQRVVRELIKNDPEIAARNYARCEMRNIVLRDGRELPHDIEIETTEIIDSVEKRYGWPVLEGRDVQVRRNLVLEAPIVHPVRDWLSSLDPARTGAIETLGPEVLRLGAEEAEVATIYLRRWCISAVARVFEPGCQADSAIVLHGLQGLKKSSFLRALAVRDEWFGDSSLDIKNKDAHLAAQRVWIQELAEMEGLFGKSEIADQRRFVTERAPIYRPPYGRDAQAFPRTVVFASTANDPDILRDDAGSRRWWPVSVWHPVDLDALRERVEDVWREALALYLAGEQWHLTEEEEALRLEREDDYTAESDIDPEMIAPIFKDRTIVLVAEVFDSLRWPQRARQDPMRSRKLVHVVSRLGYEKRRLRIEGKREYVFRKVENVVSTD